MSGLSDTEYLKFPFSVGETGPKTAPASSTCGSR
jgi:hypothetical protein